MITCKACFLTDTIDGDLDGNIHKGFTVGEKGKIMYWYFIWHGTGNASIYTAGYPMKRSYIKGDQIIKIHFKSKP